MSATLIHHGHIRLLKKASNYGKVIVALTKDNHIKKFKGYNPEIKFRFRKEILESIRYVDSVISSEFYIDDNFLKKYKIDYLVHGKDNKNSIESKNLKIFSRTKNISSTILRKKILKIMKKKI